MGPRWALWKLPKSGEALAGKGEVASAASICICNSTAHGGRVACCASATANNDALIPKTSNLLLMGFMLLDTAFALNRTLTSGFVRNQARAGKTILWHYFSCNVANYFVGADPRRR